MKTNKSARKRIKMTGTGKMKMRHSTRGHLRAAKSNKANSQDRKAKLLVLAKGTMKKAFSKLLPKN